MSPLDLVNLNGLMKRTSGKPEILVGLIDGPVSDHPDLPSTKIKQVRGRISGMCSRTDSLACQHGTFVAGILFARRGSVAPAICPDCTLLMRPIFTETTSANGAMPSSSPEELAEAIVDTVDAGARVLNLSAALARPSASGERHLEEALNYAARRGAITVAAAGNQGTVGSSSITRHSWVIPVVACDLQGRPTPESNLGRSVGRKGLRAPGVSINSLESAGGSRTFGGTSAATPFVTGAIALLWSEFPFASAVQVKSALTQINGTRRNTLVPPLLDASAAYQAMADGHF